MIKLLPEQISAHWDMVRAGLLISLPPIIKPDQAVFAKILTKLLCADMQCWAISEGGKLLGHGLTYIATDPHTDSRTLNIYSLYLASQASEATWKLMMKQIMDFAKANKCFRIGAYTQVADVLSIATKFGFNTSYHYITKDVT